jgi:hypothetical protein
MTSISTSFGQLNPFTQNAGQSRTCPVGPGSQMRAST